MMKQFKGVGVALVTPFKANGDIDFEAFTRLIDSVSRGGADYLVVLGTTGENPTISAHEHNALVRHAVTHNPLSLPIVVGIGGNDTRAVIEKMHNSELEGVSAILSVVPYYSKPNQRGLMAHFRAIIKESPLPIILYNVPGRTGVNMTAATTLTLANESKGKVIGIKEASGNLSQVAYILMGAPKDFLVISGEDNLALPTIALGGSGVISVSANCFPEVFCRMVHSALEGDFKTSAELNMHLHLATDLLFDEGNPVGVKAALSIKGIVDNNFRLPLVPASDALMDKLKAQIELHKI